MDLIFSGDVELLVNEGSGSMLVRGKERKTLRNALKAIQQIIDRDIRWLTRPSRSRMANVQFFAPAGADYPHLIAVAERIANLIAS